jgi:phenylpyruvate tautomerase PptA (4-oxalocrotonate tautomerase family)
MPKMFVHAREGAFTGEARGLVAAALTDLGIACERLADTAKVRRGIWVFFSDHGADSIFRAGEMAQDQVMSLVVYALKGGLDAPSKQRLIAESTEILGKYANGNDGQIQVYVVINEIPEVDWGMSGEQVSLAALRA